MISRRPGGRFWRQATAIAGGPPAAPPDPNAELVQVLTLANDAYADSNANVSQLRGSNPVTDPTTGDQFFAYHADNLPSTTQGKLALGKITPANVVTVDKSALTTAADDGHNFFSLKTDADSDLLVVGDMHNVAMKWQRLTGGSIDITSWATPPMEAGATDEASVTYPIFVATLPNGHELFTFRDGGSGDGKLVLKRWNPAAHTWHLVAVVVDGNADNVSLYPHRFYWDEARQRLHGGGCWRDDPNLNTNRDQIHFYLTSGDNWVTCDAFAADGSSQTLPVTVGNAAYALNTTTNVGLANAGSISIGSDGHPRLWCFRDPGDGITQLFALRYTGAAWVDSWIPDDVALRNRVPFSFVGVTSNVYRPMCVPTALCDGVTDRTVVILRSDSQGAGSWALICERADLTQWTWRHLDSSNVGQSDFAEDNVKWRAEGVADMLIMRCAHVGEAAIGPQTIKRLRFRPQVAPYTYSPPPAPWDPDSIAGCVYYGNARTGGVTITTASGVHRVNDFLDIRQGLTPRIYVQDSASDAPRYIYDTFGGRGGIRFTKADLDTMVTTDATLLAAVDGTNQPLTFIVVVRFETIAANDCILSFGSSTTHYMQLMVGADGSSLRFGRRSGGTEATQSSAAGVLAAGGEYVIVARFDGTNFRGWVNGMEVITSFNMVTAGAMVVAHGAIGCRRRVTNDLHSDTTLGVLAIYDNGISDSDRIAAQTALGAEFGITI